MTQPNQPLQCIDPALAGISLSDDMKTTPDHIHNPTYPCSCEVEFNGKAHHIRYCDQHAAAPSLLVASVAALEALERLDAANTCMSEFERGCITRLRAALNAVNP